VTDPSLSTSGGVAAAVVVVVGSINEDVVMRLDGPVHPGETVTAASVERAPGGKGANQAAAAAGAGAAVAMVGLVGADDAGRRMLEALSRAGVDTTCVDRLGDVATGTAYITLTPDGENTIVVDPGANARLDAARVGAASARIAAARVVLAQLEVPLDAVMAVLEMTAASGGRAVVTLAPARALPGGAWPAFDPVLVNQHEAAFYLGTGPAAVAADPSGAAGRLLGLGARSAVVTMGAAGAVVADRSGVRSRPAVPVERVVDTTGAGDAFAGALAASLAEVADLDRAVEAGLAAAAAVIGRLGAR